jgi:hypothetical protein
MLDMRGGDGKLRIFRTTIFRAAVAVWWGEQKWYGHPKGVQIKLAMSFGANN